MIFSFIFDNITAKILRHTKRNWGHTVRTNDPCLRYTVLCLCVTFLFDIQIKKRKRGSQNIVVIDCRYSCLYTVLINLLSFGHAFGTVFCAITRFLRYFETLHYRE
jgi:hypothetical protein